MALCGQPETLYRVYQAYVKRHQCFPDILIKLYLYQVRRYSRISIR